MAIAVLSATFVYWRWTRSPEYSLRQVAKAIKEHDLASFEKYVDVEGLAGRLIDQLLDLSTSELQQQSSPSAGLGADFAKGLISLLKPQLARAMREQIATYVEKGGFEGVPGKSNPADLSLKDLYSRAGGDASSFEGIEYVKKEGKIAIVGVRISAPQYKSKLVLEVKMRDRGGYWQVAELSNFSEFLKRIGELETKRIEQLNQPVREAINKSVAVDSVQKQAQSDSWGIRKRVAITVLFRNVGQKRIDQLRGQIVCKNLSGRELIKEAVSTSDKIEPSQVGSGFFSKEVNMFMTGDNELYETPQERLTIAVEVRYVRFADGSELKLLEK